MNAVNKHLLVADANAETDLSGLTYQQVNKQKVALGFDKAASQYNSLATIQAEIAEYGLRIIEGMDVKNASNLLDIGCGTAISCQRLQCIAQQVTGIDISFNMLRNATIAISGVEKTSFNGINADAEYLPIKSNSIDCIYSSMALQWCQSPAHVLSEVHRVLKPKGKALLCILTGDSFKSLQNGWRHIGLPSRINTFHAPQSWINASEGCNWSVKSHTKGFTSYHNSVLDILSSIKRIGANTKLIGVPSKITLVRPEKQSHYMGKQELMGLSRYLKGGYTKNKLLPLEYHLLFLEINK